MLPTEEASYIGICIKEMSDVKIGETKAFASPMLMSLDYWKPQHVYITVSQDIEPIKEGDWIYWTDPEGITSDINQVISVDEEMIFMSHPEHSETEALPHECRKIIATTDPKLVFTIVIGPDGTSMFTKLPQVQQSFLKEFVANPDGEYEVEYERKYFRGKDDKGNFENLTSSIKLKINQDNTVNITSVEEKRYNIEEIENLATEKFKTYPTNLGKIDVELKKWIKKNL